MLYIYLTGLIKYLYSTFLPSFTFCTYKCVLSTKLFDEGEYYVYRVDENNLKLAKSVQDIYYSLNNPTLSKFLRISQIISNLK